MSAACGHMTGVPTCVLCFQAGLIRAWVNPVVGGRTGSPSARCVHLGTVEVSRRTCPSCRGHVERKEFACARHLGGGQAGAAAPPVDCPPARACPGYEPAVLPAPAD